MKSNVSTMVKLIVEGLESEVEISGKHGIKTETIKERLFASNYFHIDCNNDDSEYLAHAGLGQVIQKCLQNKGYRSVVTGRFVNYEKCDNIHYLNQMLTNAEISTMEKKAIEERIRKLKKDNLAQISMIFNGTDLQGYEIPLPIDQLTEMLDEDCI